MIINKQMMNKSAVNQMDNQTDLSKEFEVKVRKDMVCKIPDHIIALFNVEPDCILKLTLRDVININKK